MAGTARGTSTSLDEKQPVLADPGSQLTISVPGVVLVAFCPATKSAHSLSASISLVSVVTDVLLCAHVDTPPPSARIFNVPEDVRCIT